MKYDDLGTRMKGYEHNSRHYLMNKTPVIIRIDGKAFHTFTRGMKKPFDGILMHVMWETTKYLCENIQNCKLGYTQSDEISLLLIDYNNIQSNSWFENNIQKITSISASMATLAFNKFFAEEVNRLQRISTIGALWTDEDENYLRVLEKKLNTALFDSRVYNLPREEVENYFIWRQQDASRNSIQMVAQSNFSHKELQNKSCNKLQDKLFLEKGINWNDLPIYEKRGMCIKRFQVPKTVVTPKGTITVNRSVWDFDDAIPIFSKDREYITQYVYPTTDINDENA
jgi:tRNA(His) 5'-end guanylyltransferase